MPSLTVSTAQRRRRLIQRHHLARTAKDALAAVAAVTAQHSSDPITPYLAAWARVPGFQTADLDAALYEQRTLWRLHAMRRTLFLVPSEAAPVFAAAAARDVATKERKRVEQWLAAEMPAAQVQPWIADTEAAVLATLAEHGELLTSELGPLVPALRLEVLLGSGKWAQRSSIGSRLLFLMAMDGRIARMQPAGTWRGSQYRWVATDRFQPGAAATFGAMDPADGRSALLRRYLAQHGPASLVDVRWWTGWTARDAKAALTELGAVAVGMEDADEGYVLPDDFDTTDVIAPHVALLPGLDSSPMGWKERGWFLGEHSDALFDSNGNAGATVWVDGRIVGGWGQRSDGQVAHRLLEDVGAEAARQVDAEAAALTAWLGGVVVTPRFPGPLDRELADRGAARGEDDAG